MNRPKLYELSSGMMKVLITDAGASVISIIVKDKNGHDRDVVFGYDDLTKYLDNDVYFGAIVGRYAGEIFPPEFMWNGKKYSLPVKNGIHLHGGIDGISFKLWNCVEIDNGLRFECESREQESGYPGDVSFFVEYRIADEKILELKYGADSSEATPVNMTSHIYFNLDGHKSGSLKNHLLQIDSELYTVSNGRDMLKNDAFPCKGTEHDFLKMKTIGNNEYDCNYILRKKNRVDAILASTESGISMEMICTQPCIQLYNACETNERGKGGAHYLPQSGICLEPQHQPNMINIDPNKTPSASENKPYIQNIRLKFDVI